VNKLKDKIDIHPEVLDGLMNKKPIVALETALVSHGLPLPISHEVPIAHEDIIRQRGVIPATMGIVDGRIKVGMTSGEIKRMAERGWESREGKGKDKHGKKIEIWKVGRREIPGALVKKVDGGFTISGTSFVSDLVGIPIFATGGLGGVHRGAETSFDVSSDLTSLSDTPVAVICSGAKSILDIGLTLEYLETLAVPVVGYRTDSFPAFYSGDSGFKSPLRLDSPKQIAEHIYISRLLSMKSGLLVANPVPEKFIEDGKKIQAAIDQAVRESEENGIAKSGQDVTPWLLNRVSELTGGLSIDSNVALLENNAILGAEVALEYEKLGGYDRATSNPVSS